MIPIRSSWIPSHSGPIQNRGGSSPRTRLGCSFRRSHSGPVPAAARFEGSPPAVPSQTGAVLSGAPLVNRVRQLPSGSTAQTSSRSWRPSHLARFER